MLLFYLVFSITKRILSGNIAAFSFLLDMLYFVVMSNKIEKKRLAILKLLKQAHGPLSSSKITEQLLTLGYEVSERTVRHYLLELDSDGLTDTTPRKGRVIVKAGEKELAEARIIE